MVEHAISLKNKVLRLAFFAVFVFLIFYSVKMSFLYTYLTGPWDGQDWRWNFDKIKWVWSYLFKPI